MIELICLYDANIQKQTGSIPLATGKHSPGKRGVPPLHLRGILGVNQTEGQGGTGGVDMKKGAVPNRLFIILPPPSGYSPYLRGRV